MKVTKLPKSGALIAIGFLVLGVSGCGNNQMLEQRLGALDAEIKGMAAKQQQAEAGQAAAAKEVDRLKELAAQFEKASAEPSTGAASQGLAGLPELKDRTLLLKGLKHLSLEKEDEIKAMVEENSAEVEGYGEPVVQMPDFLTHPYLAEVVVRIRKDGQILAVPIPFRADWEGNWKMPDSKTIKTLVAAAASGESPGAIAQPTRTATPTVAATTEQGGPKPVPQPQTPPPAPAPRGPIMPNIQGVNSVQEIDLRGKDLFKEP